MKRPAGVVRPPSSGSGGGPALKKMKVTGKLTSSLRQRPAAASRSVGALAAKAAATSGASAGDSTDKRSATTAAPETPKVGMQTKAPPPPAPAGFDKLIALLGDTVAMQKYLEALGFDATARTLGKFAPKKRAEGLRMLKAIGDEIQKPSGANHTTLTSLSGFYYNKIPHNFQGLNWVDFVIDSPDKLQEEVVMLEALGSVDVACRVMKELDGEATTGVNLCAEQYRRLKCTLEPLPKNSSDYKLVHEYFKGTQHAPVTMDVCRVFHVDAPGEKRRFEPHAESKSRVLLWHGTQHVHWISVLSRGLQVAEPGTPHALPDRVLGHGIRLWDTAAGAIEASNFGAAGAPPQGGLLFLAEVALDSIGTVPASSPSSASSGELPLPGCQSMQAHGGLKSRPGQRRKLCATDTEVRVPSGPLTPHEPKQSSGKAQAASMAEVTRRFSEYAVYDISRVRMRYAVQLEFRN